MVAAQPAPPSWVVAQPADGRTRPHLYGACPGCVIDRYTFTVVGPPQGTVVIPPEAAGRPEDKAGFLFRPDGAG